MMITAEEARIISNNNGEDSRLIKTLCDKIQDSALQGYYYIEHDCLSGFGSDNIIRSFFQRLGYDVKIELMQNTNIYIPLKRIRISWR